MVGIAILTGRHWYSPRWNDDWLALLADILSVAMGTSIALTIVVEMVGRMVLLIPDAIKNIREKEKRAQRKLRKEAYERFGIEVDGVLMLPSTPEVEAFLNGQAPTTEATQ